MTAVKNMIGAWATRRGLTKVGGAALMLLMASTPAWAARVLEDVQFEAGAGGSVSITLRMSEAVPDHQVFTTDDPPRIAVDLPDTRAGVTDKRIPVGIGSTSAITTVEAGGRTRVVIDLFRATSYESRSEGRDIVVAVTGGAMTGASVSGADSSDPAKRVADGVSVESVDFRRGADGTGRVIVRFSGDGASTDVRQEGTRVILDVAGAKLPESLAETLDVTDFATPASVISTAATANGARMTISTNGPFETMAYQAGTEYILELAPPLAAEGAADQSPLGLPGQEKKYSGTPITLNFQDVPVRSILQLIADVSELNIVAADTVQGNVTLRLVNVPWDQALDIVLQSKSLDQRRQGNVVWVAPQNEIAAFEQAKAEAVLAMQAREPLITEYIPINYASSKDIVELLTKQLEASEGDGGSSPRGFLSTRGSVTFDQRTNTLILNDIASKVDELRALIKILDRPVEQVLIESRIVIATEDFSREIGARFGFSGIDIGDNHALVTSGSLESSQNARNGLVALAQDPAAGPPTFLFPSGYNVNMPVSATNAGKWALSVLGADYLLDLELSALETEGRGEIVANPRVITANQQEAVIKQGQEVGYVTQSGSGGGASNFTVAFKEVVLELKVTPTITQDNRVFLRMNVKKDEVEGFVTTPLYSVPQISKREVNTSVLVENGQTVVLGGVYEFKSIDDLNKVPFLGDIPGLGALFRNKLKNRQKAELLIFVTPKILSLAAR